MEDVNDSYDILHLKMQQKSSEAALWAVYIVICNDKSLYTGITTNIDKRIIAHNSGTRGAKYTRARRPVSLIAIIEAPSKSAALKCEFAIKQCKKNDKIKTLKNWKFE